MQRGQISKVAGTAEGPRVKQEERGQLRKGCPEPVGRQPRPLGWSLAGKQDNYLQTNCFPRGRHHSLGKSRQLHKRIAALKRTSPMNTWEMGLLPKLRETAGWRAGQTARGN